MRNLCSGSYIKCFFSLLNVYLKLWFYTDMTLNYSESQNLNIFLILQPLVIITINPFANFKSKPEKELGKCYLLKTYQNVYQKSNPFISSLKRVKRERGLEGEI